MNKTSKIISIVFLIVMINLTIGFSFIVYDMIEKSTYTSLDVGNEQYSKLSDYSGFKMINAYTNTIDDTYTFHIMYGDSVDLFCAIDGVNEKADKEIINIERTYADYSNRSCTILYLTDNFKTKNMKVLLLNNMVEIHSDNFEKNNPNLEKIVFNSEKQLNGRIMTNISHDKLYLLTEKCLLNDGREFNLTAKDFEYLYPNVIVKSKSGGIKYWADVNNAKLEILDWKYYIHKNTKLYTDENCTELFDLNTIINKEYKYNSNGDLIYVYHPFILYTKSNY